MRIVVAPQEFKGSLTAIEAARAIADGAWAAAPTTEIDEAPMSDGGAGLVDALLAARGGERIETPAHDPLMRPITAAWALLDDGAAAIEMAAASGLVLLGESERDPLVASTYGTGELIRAALDRGCTNMIVGIGGSATVDGGAGAMQALGVRLLDASGAELPPGGASLARLDRIDMSARDTRLSGARVRVATDVTNTLCGPEGAAVVFGPQKGASPGDVATLDAALRRFAAVALRDHGVDLVSMPGGGAAGGLSAGLVLAAAATIEPGLPLVAGAVHLASRIAAADLVITGEGRLDAQTAYGKTAAGVAAIARAQHTPAIIIAGTIAPDYDDADGLFAMRASIMPDGMRLEDAMRDAARLLRDATERTLLEWLRRA